MTVHPSRKHVRLGEVLAQLRLHRRLSRTELAARVNLSAEDISMIENGQRELTLSEVVALEDVVGNLLSTSNMRKVVLPANVSSEIVKGFRRNLAAHQVALIVSLPIGVVVNHLRDADYALYSAWRAKQDDMLVASLPRPRAREPIERKKVERPLSIVRDLRSGLPSGVVAQKHRVSIEHVEQLGRKNGIMRRKVK